MVGVAFDVELNEYIYRVIESYNQTRRPDKYRIQCWKSELTLQPSIRV